MKRTNFKYIAIEGVIGAGKTSLAAKLADWYGAHPVMEEFETNPFLGDFYTDRRRYAFQTQIFFLLSRFRQQEQLRQYDLFHSKIISDYIFQKDRIFATTNLSEAEMKLYDGLARIMEQQIAVPDFVIYLKTSTSRLMANIRKRNRDYEKDMSEEYINTLNELYDSFFAHYSKTTLITINMDDVDFINSKADFRDIVKQISKITEK
ncbi:MAG: deoxynucleoside kinase [Calditrichaeota bacterium]|nr:MAG: deoxynucleoside kinase [Calditrichota bacterium]MBL1206184.1 deoxynucleoside kinase [Calditrichota bacterium]NOG46009.1 deoxynucleoside kinase [Calditrichota bacterium]